MPRGARRDSTPQHALHWWSRDEAHTQQQRRAYAQQEETPTSGYTGKAHTKQWYDPFLAVAGLANACIGFYLISMIERTFAVNFPIWRLSAIALYADVLCAKMSHGGEAEMLLAFVKPQNVYVNAAHIQGTRPKQQWVL